MYHGFVGGSAGGPGGLPREIQPGSKLATLLGEDANLNRVSYVRTSLVKPDGGPLSAILVLIPGFLGGATTFDPLARDLVKQFNGNLEVWAVDRRPNQLEDRLGAIHALVGASIDACGQPGGDCTRLFEGAQFYFPDLDPRHQISSWFCSTAMPTSIR